MLVLPREVKQIRKIESSFVELLQRYAFEEVLFPRALPVDVWTEVVSTLGDISEELRRELVVIENLGGRKTALCHWQCEPFYLTLAQLGEDTPSRVFDRSGWSYRNERHEDAFRYRQFLRLEVVWLGSSGDVSRLFDELLQSGLTLLRANGLDASLIAREDEVADSRQLRVADIICTSPTGEQVELVGAHQHGDIFVRKFWPEAPVDFETACMGISLSRIGRFLSATGQ